jgi:flagellar protein FlaJ
MWYLLPLVVVAILALPVLAMPVSDRATRLVSRLSVPLFGGYVAQRRPRRRRQLASMRAAHVDETHRAYASRTLFASGVLGGVGSVAGVYLAGLALEALSIPRSELRSLLPGPLSLFAGVARLPALTPLELFSVLVAASGTLGIGLAGVAYWTQWAALDHRATVRATAIETTLPRTVAFVYALSRSGMSFPELLDTVRENSPVYGEAARDISVAVTDMQVFGTDVMTALRQVSERTPSDNLGEFTENLVSVLGSGRSLSGYLREQYERYQEEAEAQQEQFLELLATFAEVYVTVLVAGPLFLMTVLVVIGLVISNTLPLLRFLAYLAIPLASLSFIVYIDSISQTTGDDEAAYRANLEALARGATRDDATARSGGTAATDGGAVEGRGTGARVDAARDRARLEAYDRLAPVREWLERPVYSLTSSPSVTFLVTLPLGLLWVAITRGGTVLARLRDVFASSPDLTRLAPGPGGVIDAVDEPLVQATILALAIYAVVYEVGKRRDRAIEEAIPDLLDRMASVNEAGLTVVESIRRVGGGELGPLDDELERTKRDIEWGADAATALRRFAERTEVAAVTRAVTLIGNAMAASGDVSPVLRIAADEAQQTRRLRRERRQEMLTYLLVIYVSYFVFVGIVIALTVSFIPAINEAASGMVSSGSADFSGGPLAGLRDVKTASYEFLFFHATCIQAVCSGLIAGQLGEGSVSDGAKHATIMLLIAYGLFLFL